MDTTQKCRYNPAETVPKGCSGICCQGVPPGSKRGFGRRLDGPSRVAFDCVEPLREIVNKIGRLEGEGGWRGPKDVQLIA